MSTTTFFAARLPRIHSTHQLTGRSFCSRLAVVTKAQRGSLFSRHCSTKGHHQSRFASRHCSQAVTQSGCRHSWDSNRRSLLAGLFGLATMSRTFAASAKSPIEQVLETPNWPETWPFSESDFGRYDESSDTFFYDSPRFVTHIDDGAIQAVTKFYAKEFPPSGQQDVAILDICSSWISHYPKDYTAGRISGLGMNEAELARNPVLTDFVVLDLNTDPKMPYEDSTFDVVTNAVSVDYLTKPLEVFREIQRVLKPGGLAIMSFSNRCFPTKAIAVWTGTGDQDHVWIVGSYFHYAGGFTEPAAKDISPAPGMFTKGDPMYVVYARKLEA